MKENMKKLTEDEQIQRDLYLKSLGPRPDYSKLTDEEKQALEKNLKENYPKDINGNPIMAQGPTTGYASEDKPWLINFTDEEIRNSAPKETVYEYLKRSSQGHENDIAIEYYGTKITYRELMANINNTMQAYKTIGVKKGDIVTICSLTTPELLYSWWALRNLGAIFNPIDLRYTKQSIHSLLKEAKSNYVVLLDKVYPKVKDILEDEMIEKVVVISPYDSLSTGKKIISNAKDKLKKENVNIPFGDKYIKWDDFIKQRNNDKIEIETYTPNQSIAIVHTGGTTGEPKGVVLADDNFNNASVQIENIIKKRGYRFLNIMPPFVSYGLVLGLNAPITLGWDTVVVPKFDPNEFAKLLLKNKPNGVMGIPTYWDVLMNDPIIQNADLSFLENILIGGETCFPQFKERLTKFLREHNSNAIVSEGWSQTELSAMATFETKNMGTRDSSGIPLTKTTIASFDYKIISDTEYETTTTELGYNQVGELCAKSPTEMKEFYGMPEKTDKVKVLHPDGYWIHTGDLGYVDEQGHVHVVGRIKKMFTRSGWNVFPKKIEEEYMKCECVENCAVVGVPDEIDVTAPAAFITLKNEYKGKEEEALKMLEDTFANSSLPPYFKPVSIKFMEKLPETNLGKIDFEQLKNVYIEAKKNTSEKGRSL